jgi:hypothetical protein
MCNAMSFHDMSAMPLTENFREGMNLFDDASTNVMKSCQYDELH